ncbi:hypothetical protein DKG77_15050 [Flagellimonas aquimarina]|jgi:hypothetical protein|uniref:Uncharacterized protein n=1 Tax=Flagellimonas aquimarina TaxID=2201895 RepID=A0A316KVI8_9FLAO|nr:hypothetical protein [Allomuricauda koreensis]PWL37616.1 hypothetical protein DKG77_15050 [Allomuricauda koreensis]
MKLQSLFNNRTENLGVKISLVDLKKLLDDGNKKFHFKWLSENSFVISLNFSFGTNLVFDTNYPNTKSDIIFYGNLAKLEDSKTEIKLKTKKKSFLLVLMIVLPVMLLILQSFLKIEFPVFLVALFLFPILIIGLLNFIKSEENRLLRVFIEFLNNRLNSYS